MLAFVVLCSASTNSVQRGANTFADWYRAISRHITPCVFTCLRLVVPWFCLYRAALVRFAFVPLCLCAFAFAFALCLSCLIGVQLLMEPAFELGVDTKDAVASIWL